MTHGSCHGSRVLFGSRCSIGALEVVTGAGSGIGRALSVLLASKGLHVVAVGRRQQVPRVGIGWGCVHPEW